MDWGMGCLKKRNPILDAIKGFLKVFRHFRWVISGESNVMSIFEEIYRLSYISIFIVPERSDDYGAYFTERSRMF